MCISNRLLYGGELTATLTAIHLNKWEHKNVHILICVYVNMCVRVYVFFDTENIFLLWTKSLDWELLYGVGKSAAKEKKFVL